MSIGTKHSSPFHSITHSHAEITFHLMELVLHKDTPLLPLSDGMGLNARGQLHATQHIFTKLFQHHATV